MTRFSSRPARYSFRLIHLVLATLLIAIPLAACGGSDAADRTPTQTISASPVAPTATATSMATATATSEPTEQDDSTAESTSANPLSDPLVFASTVSDMLDGLDGLDGLIEIVVALPDGTTLYELNSTEPMEAASLYKLAIMVEVFAQRESGQLSFDEEIVLDPAYFLEEDSVFGEGDIGSVVTVETLLETMISLSSNVAATALLARVGNENINQTMASLGLSSTEIRWMPDVWLDVPVDPEETTTTDDETPVETPEDDPAVEETETESPTESTEEPVEDPFRPADPTEESDEGTTGPSRSLLRSGTWQFLFDQRADEALNVTTAADMAALYLMLLNGELVSESASEEMLLLLEQQQINDRLPAYLPEGTIVAHKTGNLDGLIHDAGIVFAPAGPVVVVVLTEDIVDWQAIDLIASVARLAYDFSS